MSGSPDSSFPPQQDNVPVRDENNSPAIILTRNTDIKNESQAEASEGLESDEKVKCGEVFASCRGNCILICAFCNRRFDGLQLFGDHISGQHECELLSKEKCEDVVESLDSKVTLAKAEIIEGIEHCEVELGILEGTSLIAVDERKEADQLDQLHSTDLSSCVEYKTRRCLKRQQMPLRNQSESQLAGEVSPNRKKMRQKEEFAGVIKDKALCAYVPERHENQANDSIDRTELSFETCEAENDLSKTKEVSDESREDDDDESFKPSESDDDADDKISCDNSDPAYENKNDRSKYPHESPTTTTSTSKELFCAPCNKQLRSKRTLSRHKRRHMLDKQQDSSMAKRQRILRSETEAKDSTKVPCFHCNICDSYFKSKFSLQIHSDAHDILPVALQGNFEFLKCKFCGQQFKKYVERRDHEKTHTGVRPYECTYCKKGFTSNYDRKIHIRSHTGKDRYECPHCPKVCTNKTDIKRHIARHLNIRNYGCEMCDKRFYRPFELARHMRTHTKERPYVCEDCGATYPVMAQLKDHQLRHTGVKNIKCEICGRLFYSKSVLKVHMPTHFDEKPFECEVCGRKFSRAKAMQKHQKLHSGEKKYVCNICGKAYAQDSGLYAHKKTHGANVI